MSERITKAYTFSPELVVDTLLDALKELQFLRTRQDQLEAEIQFMRQSLQLVGEDPFPERADDPDQEQAGNSLPIAERAAILLFLMMPRELTTREIMHRLHGTPHAIPGGSPLATLMTAMRRSDLVERSSEDPKSWRLTGVGVERVVELTNGNPFGVAASFGIDPSTGGPAVRR